MSETCTHGVRVAVRSQYLPERSNPGQSQYFFAYRIRIANESSQTVQLLSRHWVITDALGHTEEVRGSGVVGEQPVLEPGDAFEYTSGCPLDTPFGSMRGSYQMVTEGGAEFEAEIAAFQLAQPYAVN
jgi:ApaG protein